MPQDLERMQQALMNADKAGDSNAARALAGEIMRMRGATPPSSITAAEQVERDPITQGARGFAQEMSGPQQFAAGAGKAFTDIGRGAGQMAGMVSQGDVAESRKLDAPLMQTGAGTAGNIAGNVAALAPTAFIPGANTYAGSALIGGVAGALQPTAEEGERTRNMAMGGIIAPAALGATRGIANTARGLKAAVDPMTEAGQGQIVGKLLRQTAGDQADDVMGRMQGARELVPGSQPTAGQVSESGGIAALERAASQADPEAYATRQMAQNAARLNAVRGVAQDEGTLAKAVSKRDILAKKLYGKAIEKGVDPEMAEVLQPQVKNLMQRMPKGVLERAKELARIQGEVMDDVGSVRGLHYVKKAVDDVLSQTGESGVGKISKGAITEFKRDLLSVIDDLSPAYKQARVRFEKASRPINQMEVGQALLNKLEPALTQGNVPVRMNAEAFARALREGDTLAQKATGFSGATLDKTLTPAQRQSLEAVRQDLSRGATASSLGKGVGSNTFQNLAQENLMQAAGVQGLPQLLSRPVQMTNYALRSVYGSANRDMQKKLAEALLDPKKAADLMKSATPSQLSKMLAAGQQGTERYLPAMTAQRGNE